MTDDQRHRMDRDKITRNAVERDERYEQLVEFAPDGILIHDGEQILAANAAALRLAGASRRDQLVGRPVDLVLHPPFLKAVGRQLSGDVSADMLAPPVRDTFHRLDGGEVEVEVRAQVFIENGRPSAHLVIRDITERLATEAVSRDLAAHIQATQRLEAVGALAGGVAHEVNNMLQVIMGFGTLVLEAPDTTDASREDLREILRAATHAAAITRQLLEFSRHAVHLPQALALDVAVRQLEPIILRLVGENRSLDVLTNAAEDIWVDPGQLEQLIVNLAINARHATSANGQIVVSTAALQVSEPTVDAEGKGIPSGRYATLTVRDSGTGMTPETQARIFEPFFTTKAIGEGTGLGLAAVAGIMAQNNGHIIVQSKLGVGTTFTLYFPVLDDGVHAPPPPVTARVQESEPRAGSTILVVEDDAWIRSLTGRILERAGFDVMLAHNGTHALELLARTGPPALVLSDIMMPEMGGRELAQRLREQWPAIPIVFMSGYSDDAIRTAASERMTITLLAKPFEPSALVQVIRTLLGIAPEAAASGGSH